MRLTPPVHVPSPPKTKSLWSWSSERSVLWFVTIATVAVALTLLALHTWQVAEARGHERRPALALVGDSRIRRDYGSAPLTSMAVVGRNLVLASDGDYAHRFRADGWFFNIWQHLHGMRSHGVLADPSIRHVYNNGNRLYFVGSGGSLASASHQFRDWVLHYGAGGFAPDLDLARDLTVLIPGPIPDVYAVGTISAGAGIYDLRTRQWAAIADRAHGLPDDHVTALYGEGNTLWVGTQAGLAAFHLERTSAGVSLTHLSERKLPAAFTGLAVSAVQRESDSAGAELLCVVGAGALLASANQGLTWTIRVDQSHKWLAGLNGPARFTDALTTSVGTWLGLEGAGPAFYAPGERRLTLEVAGLEGEAGTHVKQMYLTADPFANDATVFVMNSARGLPGALYQRSMNTWTKISGPNEDVVEATIAAGQPLTRLTDGRVVSHVSEAPVSFFSAAGLGGPAEAIESGPADLFLSGPGGVWRYPVGNRSWNQISTLADITQLRIDGTRLYAVSRRAELGVFDRFAAPQYRPIFGATALPQVEGAVTSAEMFEGKLYFLRGMPPIPYVYQPLTATQGSRIDQITEGLAQDFQPQMFRAVGGRLFLWGENGNRLYQRGPAGWTPAAGGLTDLIEMRAAADALGARARSGSVLVHFGETSATLFAGIGAAEWRKLAADRFGRVWGVGTRPAGDLLSYYDSRLGSWIAVETSVVDFAILSDGGQDVVIAATSSGLRRWRATASGVSQVERPDDAVAELAPAYQVSAAGATAWVLAGAGGMRSLWRCGAAEGSCTVQTELVSGRPPASSSEPAPSLLAMFVDDELWWMSDDRALWTYHLFSRRWDVVPTECGDAVRPASDGTLWCRSRSGHLLAYDTSGRDSPMRLSAQDFGLSWLTRWTTVLERAALGLLASVAIALAFLRYRRRASPRLNAVAVAAIVALAITMPLRWWWIPLVREFATAFTQPILHFETTYAGARAWTVAGEWVFLRHGLLLLPWSHQSGSAPPPAPAAPRLQTHTSGRWRLSIDGVLSVSRRLGSEWMDLHFGANGFVEDDVLSVAVVGDRLLAHTAAGFAEYDMEGGLLRFQAARLPSGALEAEGSSARFVGVDGSAYRYSIDAHSWLPSDTAGVALRSGPVRWLARPGRAVLDPRDFDVTAQRFRWDIAERLAQDPDGHLQIRTTAGWRRVRIAQAGLELDPTVAIEPVERRSDVRQPVTDSWQLDRRETPLGDAVTFVFLPDARLNTADPFGTRGRFRDEDVRLVFPFAGNLWIGTAAGLRQLDPGTSRVAVATGLPSQSIARCSEHDRIGYCRADDRDYVLAENTWRPVAPQPADIYNRRLPPLRINQELSIAIGERAGSDGVVPEILGFDAGTGQFAHDSIAELLGDAGGYWARTAAGVQRFRIDGNRTSSEFYLSGHSIVALRAGPPCRGCAAPVYARAADGQTWRFADGTWSRLPGGETDPFREPSRSQVTSRIWLERTYRAGGDVFTLWTASGPLFFRSGKLTIDYVLDIATIGNRSAEITAQGILKDDDPVIPLPTAQHKMALASDESGALLSRTQDGTFRFDDRQWRWSPIPFRRALYTRQLHFDGVRWIESDQPLLASSVTTLPAGTQLNGRGQWPFDAVQAVAGSDGQLWILNDSGVDAPGGGQRATRRFIPLPAGAFGPWMLVNVAQRVLLSAGTGEHASLFELQQQALPVSPAPELRKDLFVAKWEGRIGDELLRISAVASNRLEIVRRGGLVQSLDVPAPILGIAAPSGVPIVIAGRAVYLLDLAKLAAPVARTPVNVEARDELMEVLLFPPGGVALDDGAALRIRSLVSSLNGPYSNNLIAIIGYTDPSGSAARNQVVSWKRAEAVANALIVAGVSPGRLRPSGRSVWYQAGPSRQSWAEARRVEIRAHSR